MGSVSVGYRVAQRHLGGRSRSRASATTAASARNRQRRGLEVTGSAHGHRQLVPAHVDCEQHATAPDPAPATFRHPSEQQSRSQPCSPFIAVVRSRTRIANHLARPIRRHPHQPARLAGVSLAILRRAPPVESPRVLALAARARRDHQLLLRHQSCRCVTAAGNPRAGDPPPEARRIAARHANRQTQRRKH